MKEIQLNEARRFTNTLNTLNRLFVYLKHANGNDQKTFLTSLTQSMKNNSAKIAWQAIESHAAKVDPAVIVITPTQVFSEQDLPPYIGTLSKSSVLYCQDMVIGLKMPLSSPSDSLSYRIDYDPKKRLHINIELLYQNEKYPLCVLLKFSHGIFGFRQAYEAECQHHKTLDGALELMKFKFWLKMTMGYTLTQRIRQSVPQDTQSAHQNGEAQQLLNFLQNKPDYDFKTIKCFVRSLLGKKGQQYIEPCNNEIQLLQCIQTKSIIRSEVHYGMFGQLNRHRGHGEEISKLNENLLLARDHERAEDSDQRIDSEQSPNRQ